MTDTNEMRYFNSRGRRLEFANGIKNDEERQKGGERHNLEQCATTDCRELNGPVPERRQEEIVLREPNLTATS